jgi:hypothetical protein
VVSWTAEPPPRLLGLLHTDLVHYCGGELHDDVAVLVARRREAPIS